MRRAGSILLSVSLKPDTISPHLMRFKFSDAFFIRAVGYFTILTVTLLGLRIIPAGIPRLVGLGILLLFVMLFALVNRSPLPRHVMHFYFAVQSIEVATLMVIMPGWGVFPILFFVLSAQAMVEFKEREGILWVAGFTLITALVFFSTVEWPSALLISLPFTAGYWFFAAFARALKNAEQERNKSQQLLADLQRAHRQLQEYAARAEELAISEERNRLAREMHDTLGHRLTISAVQLEAVEKLLRAEPERAALMITTVKEQIRAALADLRQTVATLREPLESDLPLEHALPRLIANFRRATGIEVTLSLPPSLPALTPQQRLTLYRAIQEGLTNVHKHAQATHAWVTLESNGESITLLVRDDGHGPQGGEGGFGLRGLRERAAQLGGKVDFGPAPEGGSLLRLKLPL